MTVISDRVIFYFTTTLSAGAGKKSA